MSGLRRFDVVICGSGPAGAMTLLALGARVSALLIDRFSPLEEQATAKLCGGLLTATAQKLLPGPPPTGVHARPWRSRLEFHDLNARRIWAYDVDYANCHRGKLDRWLLREALAAAGDRATYETNARLIGLRVQDRGWRVQLIHIPSGQQEEVEARFVVDGSGWRQVSRRFLGIPLAPRLNAFQVTGTVRGKPCGSFLAIFDSRETPFYCWWIPKGEGAELGAAFPADQRKGSPSDFLAPFQTYLARRGIEFEGSPDVRGCPLTQIRQRSDIWTGRGGLLVAGEAAGMVSPSSGDGISYALGSGKAAAETILSAICGLRQDASQAEPPESKPSDDIGSTRDHGESALQVEYRQRLRPYLKELYFNIRKARWLARPRTRRWLSCLLPLAKKRRPRRLPFL